MGEKGDGGLEALLAMMDEEEKENKGDQSQDTTFYSTVDNATWMPSPRAASGRFWDFFFLQNLI